MIEFGLLQKNYQTRFYREFTGESMWGFMDGAEGELFYYNGKEYLQNYIALANRVQYNLFSCECVFIHAGLDLEALAWRKEKDFGPPNQLTRAKPYTFEEREHLKKINSTLELGVGGRFPIGNKFKMVFRHVYGRTANPRGDKIFEFNYFKLSFGLQMEI